MISQPTRRIMGAMTAPCLIVLHQENSNPGRIAHALKERGVPLDVRRPRYGDPLPDDDDFVRREIDWIAVPLKERKPFLGICLGAQMLARQLGGKVTPHPQGHAEIGYYPIRPTQLARRICEPWPDHVYQWHREGFELPAGAELIAEGDTFPVQAFRYGGAAYALQFHPDVTHAIICRWTTRGHDRMSLPGAKPRSAHFADRAVHDLAGRAWLAAFLDHWLPQPAPAMA
jgi:GMP synthase (glutamine-hydrolysing)